MCAMVQLSIISICLNEKERMEQTILSVLDQSFKDYELIIVDGGSTDGTLDVIRKYQDRISVFISEKDTGIYNAMNKGIRRSSGEYLLFLNGGDRLYAGDILAKVFCEPRDADIIYGNELFQKEDYQYVWDFSNVIVNRFHTGPMPHACSFIRKRLFDAHGLYDESYYVAGDQAFFVREICRHKARTQFVPFIIAAANMYGRSCDPQNLPLIEKEKRKAIWQNTPIYVWFKTQVAIPWYLSLRRQCQRIGNLLRGNSR